MKRNIKTPMSLQNLMKTLILQWLVVTKGHIYLKRQLLSVSLFKCYCKKMKFSIKHFFSKCDHIRSFLRIWSHLLKKPLMENFIFCAVCV